MRIARIDDHEPAPGYLRLVALQQLEQEAEEARSRGSRVAAWLRRSALRVAMIGLPALAAIGYYLFVASDQFVSEAKFVVRSASKPAVGPLSGFFQSTGMTRAADDSYLVQTFIESRDAAALLSDRYRLRELLARPEVDRLSRFPAPWQGDTDEGLLKAYRRQVSVSHDPSTGITVLSVRAFRPGDARDLASALLTASEGLINRMNERARGDSVRLATEEVESAKRRSALAQENLLAFRNRAAMVDPARFSVSLFESVGRLLQDAIEARAQLSVVMASAPQSPQASSLRTRIEAAEAQIARQRQQIASGDGSLAPLLSTYEKLMLEREFADRMFTSALGALETARLDAQRQQLYLDRVVEPREADDASYPRRVLSVLLVLLIAGSLWTISSRLGQEISDHGS